MISDPTTASRSCQRSSHMIWQRHVEAIVISPDASKRGILFALGNPSEPTIAPGIERLLPKHVSTNALSSRLPYGPRMRIATTGNPSASRAPLRIMDAELYDRSVAHTNQWVTDLHGDELALNASSSKVFARFNR